MRRRWIVALLSVSAVMACGQDNAFQAVGPVKMKLTCRPNGGFDFQLSPSTVRLASATAAFTWINDPASNVDAEIAAQDQKLFDGKKLHARHGASVNGKPAAGTDPNIYKYSVTAICNVGGRLDTMVVDPDMIIPWKIQSAE